MENKFKHFLRIENNKDPRAIKNMGLLNAEKGDHYILEVINVGKDHVDLNFKKVTGDFFPSI